MSPGHHPDYHTRDYRSGDETAITELFGKVFGACLTEAQWRWKYTGTGMPSPIARLAFNADNQLMGHAGAIALQGWRGNQPLPFFQICDIMVHPTARGQLGQRNLFTRLARELLSGLAEGWPNALAYGFPGQRPFRLGEYARIYGAVERAQSLHRRVQKSRWSWLRTQSLDWDDLRLDKLWVRLAPEQPLALARDHAYLRWRYATHPFQHYELIGLLLVGRLLGWAVIRREDRCLRVIDLLISRYWLKPALATLEHVAADSGCDELEIWLPQRWRDNVNGRVKLTEVMVTNMVWRLPISTEEVKKNLYYTMGDLDIF